MLSLLSSELARMGVMSRDGIEIGECTEAVTSHTYNELRGAGYLVRVQKSYSGILGE
jgi:hypothetical protein